MYIIKNYKNTYMLNKLTDIINILKLQDVTSVNDLINKLDDKNYKVYYYDNIYQYYTSKI